MKTSSSIKTLLPLIGIFVVVMFLYNLFASGDSVSSPQELANINIGNDLLELRNELQEVSLERDVFSDPRFLNLNDFSTAIPSQPTGRPNPFNLIGRD